MIVKTRMHLCYGGHEVASSPRELGPEVARPHPSVPSSSDIKLLKAAYGSSENGFNVSNVSI